jgi:hypothetical protein
MFKLMIYNNHSLTHSIKYEYDIHKNVQCLFLWLGEKGSLLDKRGFSVSERASDDIG